MSHDAEPEVDLSDPDNPEWTEADFARAHGPESLSEHELAAFPRTREALERQGKVPISIRLDPEVLAHFRAGGRGWQTRINEMLKRGIKQAS
jgi:uncharacterized protein (DUF4415 family)